MKTEIQARKAVLLLLAAFSAQYNRLSGHLFYGRAGDTGGGNFDLPSRYHPG